MFQVIFTLEYQGQILGRQSAEVRICACPSRDQAIEEQKFLSHMHTNSLETAKTPKKLKRKFPVQGDDDYVVKVKGKENFEILEKIRDALQVSSSLVPVCSQNIQDT